MKFAAPIDVAVEASNGASDYGNKFGEPVLTGFARSFGLSLPNGEWREYIKPIMFSAGIGMLEDIHIKKQAAEEGEIFLHFFMSMYLPNPSAMSRI